jgi:GxxExxY protein
MDRDPVTEKIIGCAIEVHRALGPGLLESAYQKCLEFELNQHEIQFRKASTSWLRCMKPNSSRT